MDYTHFIHAHNIYVYVKSLNLEIAWHLNYLLWLNIYHIFLSPKLRDCMAFKLFNSFFGLTFIIYCDIVRFLNLEIAKHLNNLRWLNDLGELGKAFR